MATGLTRREGTQNSLAGHAGVEPVLLQGPGLQTPTELRAPDLSYGTHIANELAKWSGGRLKVKADEKNERDQLAGQVAFQQGQTLDDINMGGNKWALDGYRVMDAQVASSTLFGATRQKIAETGYAQTPDQFRDTYVAGITDITKDMDPATAKLVRENMLKQMPTLVEDHTVKHMQYLEGENYNSLERSIDVISRDPTATGELVSFARGGEGSASAGLSDARRQAATVSGVIRAFDGDNPLAYASLNKEGLLGDNLTTDEQNSIKSAKGRFEQRRRSERNDALMLGEQDIISRVGDSSLTYAQAAEEMSVLYTEHGITMNAQDSGALYDATQATERTANKTAATDFENARLNGDVAAMAHITTGIIIDVESGGNPNAVSPTGAKGLMQVLDSTNTDPGFGVRPAADDSAEERVRVGKDYWATMLGGKSAHGVLKWEAGDLQAAAIAYNGGPGMANEWIESGRDDSVLTDEARNYYKKVQGKLEGWAAPTAADRLAIAEGRLTDTRERLALDTYERMAPAIADNDDAFKNGSIDETTWRRQNDEMYAEFGAARTKADVDHEIATTRAVDDALAAEAAKANAAMDEEVATANKNEAAAAKSEADNAYKVRLEAAIAATAVPRAQWETVVGNPASTPEEVKEATATYVAERKAQLDAAGIMAVDRGDGKETERMVGLISDGMAAHRKWSEEDTRIDAAVNGGYLSGLSKDMQQRAFDKNTKDIQQTYTDAVAAGGMTKEQANAGIAADLTAFYAQAGIVDPTVTMRASANMLQPFTDKDGNPNPLLIDTAEQYLNLKMLNPRAADTMLTGESMARAEAVLSRAGGQASMLPDAVRAVGIEATDNPLRKETSAYLAQPRVQEAIANSVYNVLQSKDIGFWQATLQADTEDSQVKDNSTESLARLWDNEGRLSAEVAEEVGRLQQKSPGLNPTDLVARATESVMRRTDIIGGDMVQVPRGQDIGRMFYGDRAYENMHDGVVNSDIMAWLRTDEVRAQYPFITGTTVSENLPSLVQAGIDIAAGLVPFMDLEFKPGLSMQQSSDVRWTGVRPFRTAVSPSGGLFIQVIKADGNWSEPIVLPTEEIGTLGINRRKQAAIPK